MTARIALAPPFMFVSSSTQLDMSDWSFPPRSAPSSVLGGAESFRIAAYEWVTTKVNVQKTELVNSPLRDLRATRYGVLHHVND